jgi:type I restriction enzyme M protein
LPTDLFYNTGIQTYVWLLTNRKSVTRRGKVQLIDASGERFWKSMRKSLGSKRREIPDEARAEIVRIYADFLNGESGESDTSKIFDIADFGYREIRVERPLRLNFKASEDRIAKLHDEKAFEKLGGDEQEQIKKALRSLGEALVTNRNAFEKSLAKAWKAQGIKIGAPIKKAILSALSERDEDADICTDKAGNPEPDTELRDHELVPLADEWRDYVEREVKPFVPDFWVDEKHCDARDGEIGRVGYEINFNRYFYKYVPPRPLEEIDAELKALEAEIAGLLKEVAA